MAKSSKSILLMALVALVAVAAGVMFQGWQTATPEFKKMVMLPQPRIVPPVSLQDHNRNRVTSEIFKGQWTVLFFGFTHCPDICPSTLHQLAEVKKKLSEDNLWDVQVAMVTVDPARDTPERLAQYVPFFDPDFIGLTGEASTIEAFAKSLGILFIVNSPDERANYDVDHSASLILLNPDGQFAGVLTAPHKNEDLIHDLALLTRAQASGHAKERRRQADNLVIDQAWIRPAPPTTEALAAYFTASNRGDQSLSIVGASSPVFDEIMIHTTTIDNDVASMQLVDRLTITPNSRIKLSPLGTHLMLIEPETALRENDTVPVTFEMEDGSRLDVEITVGIPAGLAQR